MGCTLPCSGSASGEEAAELWLSELWRSLWLSDVPARAGAVFLRAVPDLSCAGSSAGAAGSRAAHAKAEESKGVWRLNPSL